MNIFLHEFKSYLKSAAIWSVADFLIILVYFSAFNVISQQTSQLQSMLDAFPQELLIAFGMNDMNFSTILGWFGVVFLFCQICLAIQASNYGIGLVSIEERELTADFLLPKPVARAQILTAKFLAALAALTITNLMVWVSSFFTVNLMREGRAYDPATLAMVLGTIVVFQLFFLSVGLLISLLMKRVRSVIPLSMALAFGMYVLNAFGKMIGENSLEIISPFRHFDPNYIINNQTYNWSLAAISLAAILVAIPASYLLYQKRNITAAV